MEYSPTVLNFLEKTASITLDISKGDTILGGRFKNVPHKVKTIGTDELGQPTINGMKLLSFRIAKKMPKQASLTLKAASDAGSFMFVSDAGASIVHNGRLYSMVDGAMRKEAFLESKIPAGATIAPLSLDKSKDMQIAELFKQAEEEPKEEPKEEDTAEDIKSITVVPKEKKSPKIHTNQTGSNFANKSPEVIAKLLGVAKRTAQRYKQQGTFTSKVMHKTAEDPLPKLAPEEAAKNTYNTSKSNPYTPVYSSRDVKGMGTGGISRREAWMNSLAEGKPRADKIIDKSIEYRDKNPELYSGWYAKNNDYDTKIPRTSEGAPESLSGASLEFEPGDNFKLKIKNKMSINLNSKNPTAFHALHEVAGHPTNPYTTDADVQGLVNRVNSAKTTREASDIMGEYHDSQVGENWSKNIEKDKPWVRDFSGYLWGGSRRPPYNPINELAPRTMELRAIMENAGLDTTDPAAVKKYLNTITTRTDNYTEPKDRKLKYSNDEALGSLPFERLMEYLEGKPQEERQKIIDWYSKVMPGVAKAQAPQTGMPKTAEDPIGPTHASPAGTPPPNDDEVDSENTSTIHQALGAWRKYKKDQELTTKYAKPSYEPLNSQDPPGA
jgi:hypothetical protein